MQAAGGIDNQQIRALRLGGLDAVIDDRRGVSALSVLDNRHTRAFRPDGQLVSRRRTECIRRRQNDLLEPWHRLHQRAGAQKAGHAQGNIPENDDQRREIDAAAPLGQGAVDDE